MPGDRPKNPICADFNKIYVNDKLSHVQCKFCNAKVSAKADRMRRHITKHQTLTPTVSPIPSSSQEAQRVALLSDRPVESEDVAALELPPLTHISLARVILMLFSSYTCT